jgi:hypothetical protein
MNKDGCVYLWKRKSHEFLRIASVCGTCWRSSVRAASLSGTCGHRRASRPRYAASSGGPAPRTGLGRSRWASDSGENEIAREQRPRCGEGDADAVHPARRRDHHIGRVRRGSGAAIGDLQASEAQPGKAAEIRQILALREVADTTMPMPGRRDIDIATRPRCNESQRSSSSNSWMPSRAGCAAQPCKPSSPALKPSKPDWPEPSRMPNRPNFGSCPRSAPLIEPPWRGYTRA